MNKLPAPRIAAYQEATRVTLFDFIQLTKMRSEDKVCTCSLHACLKYSNDEMVTNASIITGSFWSLECRERKNIPDH